MGSFVENQSPEIQQEAVKFEIDQKLDALNMDQKILTVVGHNIDHFRSVIESNFDIDQREKIDSALLQMLELHGDQKDRPDGMPYLSHPLEVTRTIVEDFGVNDVDLVVAALLHDSVEDQGLKLAKAVLETKYGSNIASQDFLTAHQDEIRTLALTQIAEKHGERTARIISELSSPDFDSIAKQDTNPLDKNKFQTRKHELYKQHVDEVIQDPDVLTIKLADFLHNISDAGKLPESPQKEKYRQKYVPVTSVFLNRLGDESQPCPIKTKDLAIKRLNEATKILAQH